jgi:hypothetical protein
MHCLMLQACAKAQPLRGQQPIAWTEQVPSPACHWALLGGLSARHPPAAAQVAAQHSSHTAKHTRAAAGAGCAVLLTPPPLLPLWAAVDPMGLHRCLCTCRSTPPAGTAVCLGTKITHARPCRAAAMLRPLLPLSCCCCRVIHRSAVFQQPCYSTDLLHSPPFAHGHCYLLYAWVTHGRRTHCGQQCPPPHLHQAPPMWTAYPTTPLPPIHQHPAQPASTWGRRSTVCRSPLG